jgi:hypothetical protein
MNHQTAEQVRKKMETAFAKVRGLKCEIGRGTYDELTVSFKVTATDDASERPLVDVRAEKDFKEYTSMYGLKPGDLGKEFVLKGGRYQIIGIDAKRRKFPIVLKNLKTGTTGGFTEEAVKLRLKHPEDETARNNEYKDARTKEVAETLKSWRGKSEGFTEADLGEAFKIGGLTYTIVGAESKRTGLRIVGERDSKKFTFKSAEVLKALGRKEIVFSY